MGQIRQLTDLVVGEEGESTGSLGLKSKAKPNKSPDKRVTERYRQTDAQTDGGTDQEGR